jgi:diguanylate cyclase (GGDEF)-like protein
VVARADGDDLRHRFGDRRADEILATIGGELGGTIRLNDEAGRIDDDLFAVVCPYTDDRGAAIMAERVGTLVRERYASADTPLTLSFGVGCYPKHGTTGDALLHAVRQALDEARALGGDRAVTYFSAENSIEERLRGSGPILDVIASEPADDEAEADVRVVSRG